MIIKLIDKQPFKAGDLTTLTEILHPVYDKIKLPYSLAYAFLEPDQTSLLHTLKESEVYFIINGTGKMILGRDQFDIKKGDCIYVASGMPQSVRNTGQVRLEFICIVSPPWSSEGEKILER